MEALLKIRFEGGCGLVPLDLFLGLVRRMPPAGTRISLPSASLVLNAGGSDMAAKGH